MPSSLALAVDGPPPTRSDGALWRTLAIYVHEMPGRTAATVILYLIASAAFAWQQWLIGQAVVAARAGNFQRAIAWGDLVFTGPWAWVLVLGGVALLRGFLHYAAGASAQIIGQQLMVKVRLRIFAQAQRLDLAYHWRHGAGELLARTTRDSDKLRDALVIFWRQVIDTLTTALAAIAILGWYAPSLGLVPCLLLVVSLLVLVGQTDRLVVLDRTVGARHDAVSQNLIESVNGVRVIKSFRLESSRTRHFARDVAAFAEAARQALHYACRRIPLPQFIVALGQVWVLAWGALLVAQHRLDVGELVAALLTVNLLILRFETVGAVVQTFADARASAARLWELFDARPAIVSGSLALPDGAWGLRFEHVGVAAPGGGNEILRDVSFTLSPGEIVALVGNTGSGKSTLLGLLPRLYEATKGDIRVGSDAAGWRRLRDLDLTDLRRRVHVLPQETFLFTDTLEANLRLAAPTATAADLRRAITAASADDVVAALPDGLATRVGDRGITLSGGQRQRICLARALLADATVLGLDDATSALDAATERTVIANLRALRSTSGHALAVLVASTRLSTVLLADRVLLLADGRIAAEGSHEQLAATSAHYRELMGI